MRAKPAQHGLRPWQKGEEQANRQDARFFRLNAHRCFHLRPAMPFEFRIWNADGHLNYSVIMMRSNGQTERLALPLNKDLPDDEGFLARLWVRVRRDYPGGKLHIPSWEMLAMLKETGNWPLKDRANG